MEEVLRMSEQDFSAGHKADVQLALLFVTGFSDQDETLRTALSLLRRKYTFVKHVIATVVRSITDFCLIAALMRAKCGPKAFYQAMHCWT